MRVEVLTSLYPSAPRPVEGLFAERRWTGMRARGHAVHVTQPLPLSGRWLPRARWRALAALPARELRAGIEVLRPRYLHLPGLARRNARAFARAGLAALARGPRPDVVVLDYAWPAGAAAPLLARQRLPCVVSGRGSDVLQVAGEAGLAAELTRALQAAGHWCGVSNDLVATLDRLGGRPGQGVLVPNGVDLELFRPRPRAEARAALGLALPEGARLVLVVGHWIERKDPLLALEVFARATSARAPGTGTPGGERLVFLGRGPLEGALRRAIATDPRGLASRVELRDEVAPDELALWYAACDLLLLTSRREGRPNVLLEALACGRPVLATEAGGTSEVLGPWRERLASSTREPESLARQLATLLEESFDPQALRASVQALRWEASFEALEACLRAAIAGGQR